MYHVATTVPLKTNPLKIIKEIDEALGVPAPAGCGGDSDVDEYISRISAAWPPGLAWLIYQDHDARRVDRSKTTNIMGCLPSEFEVWTPEGSWAQLPDDDEVECAQLVRDALVAKYMREQE